MSSPSTTSLERYVTIIGDIRGMLKITSFGGFSRREIRTIEESLERLMLLLSDESVMTVSLMIPTKIKEDSDQVP